MDLDRVVNLELLANPVNWIIVILMLAIAVYGINLLAPSMDQLGAFATPA
jgi:hypothetical protein